jgi:phage-related protein
MALDTFPSIAPEYSSSPCDTKARVLRTDFGDGYGQRAADGINNMPRTWPLKWENLTEADANTIENFLRARAGYVAFLWTPPRTGTALKWTCEAWSRQPTEGNFVTMTATFNQVFDL